MLTPLFIDPVRAVRIEAAEVLAGVPPNTFPADVAVTYSRATDEYIAAQEFNSDRPEAHMNLGLFYAKENHFDQAEKELTTALSIDPTFGPAAVNLADLYRVQNRDTDGERVLQVAISHSPNDASLQYALGLLRVRERRSVEALDLLRAAARLDPGNTRYAYAYAVALHDAGQSSAAIETLETSINMHRFDRDSLVALVTFLEQAGAPAKALIYAQRLEELEPGDLTLQRSVIELKNRLKP